MTELPSLPMWLLLAGGLAWLVPTALTLLAAAGLPDAEARQVALTLPTALALAVVGYMGTGFALHYGGIGLVVDHPDLAPLVWEWSAIAADWGATWGMAGMAGFGLRGVQTPLALALFVNTLPWVTTATLLPLLALRGRLPSGVVALVGLGMAAAAYPLVGNWVQGGGWLAYLGFNIGAGHGFVDFGGAWLFGLAGAVALAGILAVGERLPRPTGPADLPPVHLPLLAAGSAGLLLVGSSGWLLAWPLTDWATLSPIRAVVNGVVAAAGGGLLPLAYTWFVAGRPDPLLGARGVAAGWVAGLAGAPFWTPLAASLVGGTAGLLMLLGTYVLARWLRLYDRGGVLTTFGLPALVGMPAVGLLADGTAGVGYNGIGAENYLGVTGQGVAGLWPAVGFAPDWPGQFLAQAIAAGAVFLPTFLAVLAGIGPIVLIARAWRRRPSALAPAEPSLQPADEIADAAST
ncbi:MAG: ammonium transporter [Caldilineales bacterium]|nr:ammonium transporter [Caldilineales bacterium]